MPVDDFFPHASTYISPDVKAICDACPVRRDCLIFALKNGQEYGIWGGATEKQRRDLRRKMAGKPIAPCGTSAAYQRHLRDGDEPCAECHEAKKAAQRAYHAANAQTINERRLRARNAPTSKLAARA